MPAPVVTLLALMAAILMILGIVLLGIAYKELREKEWVSAILMGSMGVFICGVVVTSIWMFLAYP